MTSFCSRFARKLLVAVMEKWDSHVLVIDRVAPPNWKVCTQFRLQLTFLLFTCTFVFCSNVYSEAAYLSVLAVMVCLWLCALFVQVLYALTLPEMWGHINN